MITTFSTEVFASTLAAATRLLRGFILASVRMARTPMVRAVAMRAGIFALALVGDGRVDGTYTCHLASTVDPRSCPKQTQMRSGFNPKDGPDENRERTGRTETMRSNEREANAQRIRERPIREWRESRWIPRREMDDRSREASVRAVPRGDLDPSHRDYGESSRYFFG